MQIFNIVLIKRMFTEFLILDLEGVGGHRNGANSGHPGPVKDAVMRRVRES